MDNTIKNYKKDLINYQKQKFQGQLKTLNQKINQLPKTIGQMIDTTNPQYKKLSNKRALLYEKIKKFPN